MPTVPRGPASPDMPVPSETDFWMALATMKELGRFSSRLDPSKQDEIEDRRGEIYEPGAAEDARSAAARKGRNATLRPADQIFKEFDKMKAKRRDEYESASTGVSGGSR